MLVWISRTSLLRIQKLFITALKKPKQSSDVAFGLFNTLAQLHDFLLDIVKEHDNKRKNVLMTHFIHNVKPLTHLVQLKIT